MTAAVRAEEAVGLLAIERAAAARQAHAIEVAEARRIEAEEQRRQQELLIDVTSHEIRSVASSSPPPSSLISLRRNPISAILNNSDLTRSSLVALRETLLALDLNSQLPSQLGDTIPQLEEDIEAIESISECAMAQERIANDILVRRPRVPLSSADATHRALRRSRSSGTASPLSRSVSAPRCEAR